MTILTPEVRALLKRMDADDAIDKAVELALEAAARKCQTMYPPTLLGYKDHRQVIADECANAIDALKEQK